VGLIAKNGILIVEFANTQQARGASKQDAVLSAAVTRLRPIAMTTVATVLGHFPLTLVSGAGAVARNSIGIVLVGGMSIGTLFTLFVVPCLYVLIARDHGHARFDERDAEETRTYFPGDAELPASIDGESRSRPSLAAHAAGE
jgi:multidrug efflux pump